mgnify:CR=1 FL=1
MSASSPYPVWRMPLLLAAPLALKLGLPVIQFSSDLLIIRAQFRHLRVQGFELRFQRCGRLRHLRFALSLRLLLGFFLGGFGRWFLAGSVSA